MTRTAPDASGPETGPGARMMRFADMLALARAIRDCAADEPEQGRIALAWVALNRMRAGQAVSLRDAESTGGTGGAWADFADPAFCRALAAVCLVSSGDLADPTRGATLFHAHTENPCWARGANPSALIGGHFFYAPGPDASGRELSAASATGRKGGNQERKWHAVSRLDRLGRMAPDGPYAGRHRLGGGRGDADAEG